MYSFYYKILFPEFSSLYWQPFPESCAWEVLKSVSLLFFAVKSLIDTEYFSFGNCNVLIGFRQSVAWIIVYWILKKICVYDLPVVNIPTEWENRIQMSVLQLAPHQNLRGEM